MSPCRATGPEQLLGETVRPRAIEIPTLNARINNPSTLVEQEDIAARIIGIRYGLAPHLAELVCRLAGLGEARS